jgi:hypothetical protein
MTRFNPSRILAGAAAAAAITLAVSGSALAHGMGGMGHMGSVTEHGTTNFVSTNKSLFRIGSHDGHRFRTRFGVAYLPDGCIYRWTELGRVRICPDYGY